MKNYIGFVPRAAPLVLLGFCCDNQMSTRMKAYWFILIHTPFAKYCASAIYIPA